MLKIQRELLTHSTALSYTSCDGMKKQGLEFALSEVEGGAPFPQAG